MTYARCKIFFVQNTEIRLYNIRSNDGSSMTSLVQVDIHQLHTGICALDRFTNIIFTVHNSVTEREGEEGDPVLTPRTEAEKHNTDIKDLLQVCFSADMNFSLFSPTCL